MAALFETVSINGMSLSNRFVRSATWEGLADKEGRATQRLTDMMAELASGDVGLIISSFAFISREGQSNTGQLAAYDDRFVPELSAMTQAVHSAGGKIAFQLVHGGCFSNPELTGTKPIGPSVYEEHGAALCRAMTDADIEEIVSAYTSASVRARNAGFDAVQIHCAHGYLLSQFLSGAFNCRTDEYGGSLENRARLLLRVVRNVRDAVGPDYPVLVKLNSEDFMEKGLTREESIKVAEMLQKASVDAIELSGGSRAAGAKYLAARKGMLKSPEDEVYYRVAARLYKQQVSIPLMLVGGIRSYEVADDLVRHGFADFISLCRPLIREPHLVKRWKAGDRRKAECISCNGCYGPAREGKGISCVVRKQSAP